MSSIPNLRRSLRLTLDSPTLKLMPLSYILLKAACLPTPLSLLNSTCTTTHDMRFTACASQRPRNEIFTSQDLFLLLFPAPQASRPCPPHAGNMNPQGHHWWNDMAVGATLAVMIMSDTMMQGRLPWSSTCWGAICGSRFHAKACQEPNVTIAYTAHKREEGLSRYCTYVLRKGCPVVPVETWQVR
ncbi:hypothetical protein AcW1_002688 [Taiwanofungus camphoratus]|nr:hypothetical protein AcW1_002688 [Antrodia cinnamomea]